MSILVALSDKEILALTIIGEGRGEPIEGQVAIGCVCRNRLHTNPGKYHNYHDVCLAREQFSCWNTDDSNYALLMDIAAKWTEGEVLNDPYIRQCQLVASGVVDWAITDNTKGAQDYLTAKLFNSPDRPKWAKAPLMDPIQKGSQLFFSV